MSKTEKTAFYRGVRITSGMPRQPVELRERPAWFTDPARACNPEYGVDHLFTSDDLKDRNIAAKICQRRCPFIRQCFEWAVANQEQAHVWGGQTFTPQKTHQPAGTTSPETEPAAPKCRHCAGELSAEGRCARKSCSCPKCRMPLTADRRCRRSTCYTRPAKPSTVAQRREQRDRQVRELWVQGLADVTIALRLGCGTRTVSESRERLGLPTRFGPGGKPVTRVAVPA